MKGYRFFIGSATLLMASLALAHSEKAKHPASASASASEESMQAVTILTFDQLLTRVKHHHPKLYSADIERRIAGSKLLEKQGAFDANVSVESDYMRYNDFTNKGKLSKAYDNDLSLNWLTRSGLKFSTGARYNTGDVKPPLYPTGSTGEYFVGMYLPLMRGFRMNEKAAAELQAKMGIPLADAIYNEVYLSILLQASYAYWDWVIATRKVEIAKNILTLAQVRYQAIQERIKHGDLPSIDAVEAGQEVQRRQGILAKLTREYEKQRFKLSRYLWEPGGEPSPLPQEQHAPVNIPEPSEFKEDEWMEGRKAALEKRPELKSLNFQKEITEVDLNYAKNLRLPILNFFATTGYDTGNKSVGPTIKTGFNLVIPLRQRTANGLIEAANFKIKKLEQEQKLLLQQVLLEVDDAVSAINAAHKQYAAAQEEYKLALQLEEGEREKFKQGVSTLFLVNQRERSSAEAAIKTLDLKAEYQQTLVNFKVVTNQL